MVKAVLFASLLHSIKGQTLPHFDSFIETHGRTYQQGSAEYEHRRSLYEQRKVAAETHNSQENRLWTAGINKLSDWTEAELLTLQGWDGARKPSGGSSSRFARPHSTFLQQAARDLPKEMIWKDLGMYNHVKDQGACGSCWAIASATTLEAHAEIYSGTFKKYSAQQIVSCTPNPKHCGGEGGCKGATAELAMEWVMQNGLAEETAVPYTATNGVCSVPGVSAKEEMAALLEPAKKKGGAAIGMTGWETLPKNEYAPLIQALTNSGPVAVSVGAGNWFQYQGGIFDGCAKDVVISHAVVAIGYGETEGKKYWVIQNSWGADWGEQGHIRMLRHDGDEYCGMNNDPQKGVACMGETDPVPVCGMCGVLFDSVVPHFGNK